MKRYFSLLTILLPLLVTAQEYCVLFIPDSLTKNACAVLRIDETTIIIHSIGSATIKSRYAFTILNEKGDHFAEYSKAYDNFEKLTEVSGKLFDAFGKKIKSVRKKEMEDVAYESRSNLMDDARIKKHNFYCKQYPYTIEYEDEVEYKGIHNFPSWNPILSNNLSVQKSSYRIEMPVGYQLRYKLINGIKEPIIETTEKTRSMQWELYNLTAFNIEPLQPSLRSIMPNVLIGPTDFEYGGYKGNMNTWKSYGEFYQALCKGRDELPDNIKKQVHTLVDGISEKEQKVKILYEYLQNNSHYISIQLGIGGLQPFAASYVAEKKYGDCKALSNYMVSLLKEAGVKSYSAIINGGKNKAEFYEDFPKDYFNHVVACVPDEKDTIWLECTSQINSMGYSGSFTGNRKAFLITDDGGKIVNTPSYTSADNKQIRKVFAEIDESGTLTADVYTHYTGIQQELPNELLNEATAEERQKFLNSELSLPTYKVDKIEYKESKGKIPAMDERLKITAENYANISEKRLFIVPDFFNKGEKLPIVEKRKFAVELKNSYMDSDSISIKIPTGYTIESVPKLKKIENKYGSYFINCLINDDKIQLVRIREQNAAIFPAEDYSLLINYFDTVYKADRQTIVFVKKDSQR